MKKYLLILSMVLVYACDITGNGDPNPTPSQETYYAHRPTTFHFRLLCACPDSCSYNFFYYGYECSKYTLWMDSVEIKVLKEFTVPEDGHIRFSMLDYYKNEKTYDIDVNPIVHSYRIVDDSVEISFPPEYTYKLYKTNEYGLDKGTENYSADTTPFLKIYLNDITYEKFFSFESEYNHQSSLQEDSIYISGKVYWDWKE